MVLKALYDAELVSEGSLIKRYTATLDAEGFAEAKKRAKPFIEWLQTEDSDEESDDSVKAPEVDLANI